MNTQNKTTAVQPKLKVVLNGGKEINSATIRVKWFVSEDVKREKDPRYTLFFVQNEAMCKIKNANQIGRRTVCEFDKGVKKLTLHFPGYHRLMVLIIGGTEADEIVKRYLTLNGSCYYEPLDWQGMKEKISSNWSFCPGIAATIVEFEVPAQLFVQRPETKPGKVVWKWVNL